MQIEILIKIAGLGLLVSVIMTLLKQSGREELAALVAVVGLAIGTLLVLETKRSSVSTLPVWLSFSSSLNGTSN